MIIKKPVSGRVILLRAGILGAALALAGCTSGMSDLEAEVRSIKSQRAPPLDPLPVMRQFETFEYAAQDLRDPFSDPTEERASAVGSGPRPDPDRRKELLETFPLDGLRMVGTLDLDGNSWGLVQDPEAVIHRVRADNYMGHNDGRIVEVLPDRIELVELVPDGAGGWLERRSSLALNQD
jgi:type IV pilus assembly protein PilP